MKLEWMEPYRDIIGNFYRSANGYSQICKNEMFGEPVSFSPYEVQIIEHILEHAEQHRNMKWYASRLGLSQATYSKYVRKLVDKGLLEKYHTDGNRKDVILMVSPLGLEEYRAYSDMARSLLFRELFDCLGHGGKVLRRGLAVVAVPRAVRLPRRHRRRGAANGEKGLLHLRQDARGEAARRPRRRGAADPGGVNCPPPE